MTQTAEQRGRAPRNLKLVATAPTSVDDWVRIIRADMSRTIEGFVTTGQHLIEAKKTVGHRNWLALLREVGISQPVAYRLVMIGTNEVLANHSNWNNLPTAQRALYELSRAPADHIENGIKGGVITPQTTEKDARSFVNLVKQLAAPSESDEIKPTPKPEQKSKQDNKITKWSTTIQKTSADVAENCDHLTDEQLAWLIGAAEYLYDYLRGVQHLRKRKK